MFTNLWMLLLPVLTAICALQSTLCMLSFFTIFWWYGVPLSAVYNKGTEYWMNPNSGNNLSFNCWWVRMHDLFRHQGVAFLMG